MTEPSGIVGEFFALRREADADVLAMQVGDFFEFFADDAETVADELDLKLSKKSSGGEAYSMAGVPVDDVTPYLKALVERGYRVAVAEQYETADGHARELSRVVTPGTLLETDSADAQYIAAVVRAREDVYGLAFADATTGQFLATAVTGQEAESEMLTELYRFDPVEVLPGPDVRNDDAFLEAVRERTDASLSVHDVNAFARGAATHAVREQFGEGTLASLGLDDGHRAEARAAGAILSYVDETGLGVRPSMTRLQTYRVDDNVNLDATTQRNLELTETMHGDADGSLLNTIDHTVTSPGRRLLKEWLQRPRRSLSTLRRRHDAVEAFTEAALARDEIRETLSGAYDLERLVSKAAHGSADARDLVRVRETLAILPRVAAVVEDDARLANSPLAAIVDRPDRDAAAGLQEELNRALVDDPPGTVTQGGLFRVGYHDELDDLIEGYESAMEWVTALAEREKREHGITHLQVDRNRTDGYYIQVGKSETDSVPSEYERIKTLKNSKRYTTPALEEREREILQLEERRHDLERELFESLRERVAARAQVLQDVGRTLAAVDVFASKAKHAISNRWTRPELVDGNDVLVEQGRHPVVEQTTEFVPNDVEMSDDREFLIVTGPNMSGKSTYMRQVALATLLAQVGSFVPARAARIGVVDGIFTRVGALDELAQGRSTFMVEMQELSNILHSATDESLVILDEVGRGTATYDGISIAWAATEYLHNKVQAKTLFATHYHELTTLADHLKRVENVHVAAEETGDEEVTFLRTVQDGPTDRSYGIHVADLAAVPKPVVTRARDVLSRLRADEAIEAKGAQTTQQVVFDVQSGRLRSGSAASDGGQEQPDDRLDEETVDVLRELTDLPLQEVPPIELVNHVQEWQSRLENGEFE